MNLSPGSRFGVYDIVGLLGTGGMGEVYRGRDPRLKRDVAIKVLPAQWAQDTDRRVRFQREAEVLATLNHPNIAAIYGLDECDGVSGLLLELVEGPTLADRVRQSPLRLADALAIARQIADALDAAHERGIVHRDLKPANIKVRDDGVVKVLDFGLAKALEIGSASPVATTLSAVTVPAPTETGVILGTPAYMSPEQARGQTIDRRTDIWAFGCVVYEMLAGRPAFGGDTVMDTISTILDREPDWTLLPASTPASVRRLIRSCLQKDRKARLRDIGDARVDLDPALESEGGPAQAGSTSSRAAIVGVAGVALVVGSIAATLAIDRFVRRRSASVVDTTGPSLVLEQATADVGVTADPALSVDGTLLAYASDRSGMNNLDIWVQTLGSEPIPVTSDPADEMAPAFSPLEPLLAFRSEREGGGIYLTAALGRQEPQLKVPDGRRPRFSPDGRFIAYWTGSNVAFNVSSGSYKTFIVPVDGGVPKEVQGFTGARYPVWAPDGQSLLLLGSQAERPLAGTYDWWQVPRDGTAPIRLGVGPILQRAGIRFGVGDVGPADWRGDSILFSDNYYLWSLQIDSRTLVPLSVERLTFGTGRDLQPTASKSGLVAFTSAVVSNAVWALPIDATRGVVTGEPRPVTSGGFASRPSATANGQFVAYRSTLPGPTILIKDRKAGIVRNIGMAGSGFGPALAPDGTQVAYEAGEGDNVGVEVVPVRGGTPRTLCRPCRIGAWWDDSRAIVVVKPVNNAGRLTSIGVTTEVAQDLIVSSEGGVDRPFVSPDRRFLVFRHTGTKGDAIMIAPLTTSQPAPRDTWVELVSPELDARPVGWSPDGRLVYFASGRDGTRCLYFWRIDPSRGVPVGPPTPVHHFHGGRNVFRAGGGLGNVLSTGPGTAISDGYFFYDLSDLSANIWTMKHR